VRLRVTDPEILENVVAHFERSGFVVRRVGDVILEVVRPDAPTPEQERREVEIHLGVWRVMHPGRTPVELIEDEGSPE
jgi:hypothetical protein